MLKARETHHFKHEVLAAYTIWKDPNVEAVRLAPISETSITYVHGFIGTWVLSTVLPPRVCANEQVTKIRQASKSLNLRLQQVRNG